MGNFFFFLFLKHVGHLTMNGSSFLGDPTVLSSEGKVYGGLRFWLKRLCRMAGHDICQGVGLANDSGVKESLTLFP